MKQSLNYKDLKQKSISYTPTELVNRLSFGQAMQTACEMLRNEEWDEQLQIYAADILELLRQKYPEKWNSSWRFDAFLGYAYHILLKYDERYAAYKSAFDKVNPKPPQLLIAMARCYMTPGKPPITEQEAINLVKQAVKDFPCIEGFELLAGLYKSMGNIKEQEYWQNFLKKQKAGLSELPTLDQIPNGFLID